MAELPLPTRLEKWVHDATSWPRSATRAAIEGGSVTLVRDGAPSIASDPDALVFEGDAVHLSGRPVAPRRAHVSVLFHKPLGVTSTTRETQGREDLSTYIARMPEGCRPVGRLDRESTGALLLTSDGDLANALLRPQSHAPKVYLLTVKGRIAEGDARLAAMRAGVESPVGRLTLAELALVGHTTERTDDRTDEVTKLRVVLTAGRNRHIRRMCFATGLRLLALHRTAIGPLALGDLAPRSHRVLADAEVEALWAAVGGRARVRQLQRAALEARARELRERGAPDERLEAWLASSPS